MRVIPSTTWRRTLGFGAVVALLALVGTAAIGGNADTIDRSTVARGEDEAPEQPVAELVVPDAAPVVEADMSLTARLEKAGGLDRSLLPAEAAAVLDAMPAELSPVDHRSEPGREELLFRTPGGGVVTVWWQAVTADVTGLVAGEGTPGGALSDGGSYTVRDTSPAFIQILVTRPGLVVSVVAEKNPYGGSAGPDIDRATAISLADATLTALGA